MEFTQEIIFNAIKNSSADENKAVRILFESHYSSCKSLMLRTSSRIDNEQCEDIFTESVMLLYNAIKNNRFEIRHENSIKAFLRRTCLNKALSEHRRSVRFESLENVANKDFCFNRIIDEERREALMKEVFDIFSSFKNGPEILKMRVFEKMSYDEIAEELNFSNPNSVKNSLYRMMKAARKHFENVSLEENIFA